MTKENRGAFALALIATLALAATPAFAQDDEDEGPANRVVSVTTFELPYHHRSKVIPWMQEYFVPGAQLNPNVITSRVLFHLYGDHGSQIVFLSEYADWADIDADCGAPCEEYFEAHPFPEEGDEGYEEFAEAQELFNKYYSHHKDMIYTSTSNWAKTEGEILGRVGPAPDDE